MAFNRREEMMMMMMVARMGTNLASFLYRNVKGYRGWLLSAMLFTIVQVATDVLIAFPFKFILDKVVNHKNPGVPDGLLTFFDMFGGSAVQRQSEPHSILGIILFSASLLLVLNIINALTMYVQNSIASIVGKNLAGWLRKDLFAHIQRLSLDWHNRQK